MEVPSLRVGDWCGRNGKGLEKLEKREERNNFIVPLGFPLAYRIRGPARSACENMAEYIEASIEGSFKVRIDIYPHDVTG
jgi:hypothetical protein